MQNCIIRCMSHISIHKREFISLQNGEDRAFYLTHPGVYRKRLVSTTVKTGAIVQYAHHSKLPSEMKLFVAMMKVCGFPLSLSSPR